MSPAAREAAEVRAFLAAHRGHLQWLEVRWDPATFRQVLERVGSEVAAPGTLRRFLEKWKGAGVPKPDATLLTSFREALSSLENEHANGGNVAAAMERVRECSRLVMDSRLSSFFSDEGPGDEGGPGHAGVPSI